MDKIPKNAGSVVKISGGSVSAARRQAAVVAAAGLGIGVVLFFDWPCSFERLP
jgi:hypothetical protein